VRLFRIRSIIGATVLRAQGSWYVGPKDHRVVETWLFGILDTMVT
jgi:hypothetical protein